MTSIARYALIRNLISIIRELRSCQCECKCGVRGVL